MEVFNNEFDPIWFCDSDPHIHSEMALQELHYIVFL